LAWIFSSEAGEFLVFLAGSVEHWSNIVAWIYLGQDYQGIIFSVHVCESLYLVWFWPEYFHASCFNSWATGPVKSRSILEYYFAYSYLRFCTCYVDENTSIRFSEKLYPNS
jgi:hypothetical protein